MFGFLKVFLVLSFGMSYSVVVVREKKLSNRFFLPRKFSNESERRAQVSTSFFLQLTIAGITLLILKNRALSKCFFYPDNEVMAFPKIEIKFDWVSNVHVDIKSDAIIWVWQFCHVRTLQTSENYITDRKCVVQTNSQVKWS